MSKNKTSAEGVPFWKYPEEKAALSRLFHRIPLKREEIPRGTLIILPQIDEEWQKVLTAQAIPAGNGRDSNPASSLGKVLANPCLTR